MQVSHYQHHLAAGGMNLATSLYISSSVVNSPRFVSTALTSRDDGRVRRTPLNEKGRASTVTYLTERDHRRLVSRRATSVLRSDAMTVVSPETRIAVVVRLIAVK